MGCGCPLAWTKRQLHSLSLELVERDCDLFQSRGQSSTSGLTRQVAQSHKVVRLVVFLSVLLLVFSRGKEW